MQLAEAYGQDATVEEAYPGFPAWRTVGIERWRDGQTLPAEDRVADEVPVALVYNGISHAVMLASPVDLDMFALGFSLTEGIIRDKSDLYDLEVMPRAEGIELQMTIAQEAFANLKERRRSMAGRTGCGLCGAENLAQVVRHPAPLGAGCMISPVAVHRAFAQLTARQPIQALTGAVHAAAWADASGQVLLVQEDVGRHNALDKLIGALATQAVDVSHGFAIVTSRASYEMVQKAASYGITLLAAISAPTGLAIDLARETGLTLLGFTRQDSHVIYANPQRIQ